MHPSWLGRLSCEWVGRANPTLGAFHSFQMSREIRARVGCGERNSAPGWRGTMHWSEPLKLMLTSSHDGRSVSGLPSKNGLDPHINNMNHACSKLLMHLSQEATRVPLPVCGMNLKPQYLALWRNSTKLCWKINKQINKQPNQQCLSRACSGLLLAGPTCLTLWKLPL